MPLATMTSKGQITVPKEIRERLKLDAGSKVWFVYQPNGRVELVARTGKITDLFGVLYDPNRKPVTIEEMNDMIADAAAASGMDEPYWDHVDE